MRWRHVAIVAAQLAACAGNAPPPNLEVTAIRSDGVDAILHVGGDSFDVSSQLETRPAVVEPADPLAGDVAPSDETVRTTTVRNASGELVATFSIVIDDEEMTGSISNQSFGLPEDVDSDDDAEIWTAIERSHDGQVVANLSRAATESLSQEVAPGTELFLADASHVGDAIDLRAGQWQADASDLQVTPLAAQKTFTTLGWNFQSGPDRRILLIPNAGGVIGIHTASNHLDIADKRAEIQQHPDNTLGIREVEPYEYNTSHAYRRMVARLVHEAQGAGTGVQPILVMFNSGSQGSHDPMTTLPGINDDGSRRPVAARALRMLLRRHPSVHLSVELYCAGNMDATGWQRRREHLGRWAATVGVARKRVTIDEDLSNTTVASGEHYGTLGEPGHFNSLLQQEAAAASNGGWAGIDYVATPPSGAYPTLTSTYNVVAGLMQKY